MKRYGFMVWGFFCHFWIDFSCSWFIFQEVVGEAGWYTLLFFYNFYAFALELPLGVLLDRICEKNKGSLKGYSWTGIAGIFLVLLALSFVGIGSSLISRGLLGVYGALLSLIFT